MAQKQKKALKKFDKLDPDAPVIPSLASMMEVEIVAGSEGEVMVIITDDIPETYWWSEYDIDLKQLYFVTVNGKVQGLGLKIHECFEEHMTEGQDVRLVRFDKKNQVPVGVPYIVPLVVRKHTLEDPSYG